MKIAVSVIANAFKNNGTTVRAIRILEILKNRYKILLITRANEKQKLKDLEDIDIVIVKPDRTKHWNLKLIPIIMKNKFDVVYCSHDWFGFLTYYLLSKIYGYKIIFEAHSILSEEHKEMGYSKIRVKLNQIHEKFVIKHADHVIALSENTFKFYEKYNKNIYLIPVFIDENVFTINKEIETKKCQSNYKLIGLIGPFNTIVNEYSLESLYNNIKRFDDKIKFVVIGKCDNKIENERITYTGYLESIPDYIDALSNLDVVLIASKIATSGPLNKIIEPMSCSLPVFTTPKGLLGLDYVKKDEDILVFEEDELVNKVNELIFDDELMKKVGKNARITVEKYYSKKTNEKKLMEIIKSYEKKKR